MRIQADVEILNRDFNSKTKPVRSSLAIGLKPQDSSSKAAGMREVFMMISTAQNKSGSKFILRNDELQRNVEHIFDKFVSEGKATIRLRVPSRDFCLRKADPIQLKAFLNIVKGSLNAKTPDEIDKLCLTSASYAVPATSSQVTKPKSKLIVTEKKEYPITTNFPSTLETLVVTGINLKKMDSRILKLRHLVSLDLTGNSIKDISVFGDPNSNKLDALKEIKLASNQIEIWPLTFCASSNFQRNLRLLDMSGNKFKSVPFNIYRLKELVTLKLNNNTELVQLPPTVGQMFHSLKNVDLNCCQNLKFLPGSIARLRLDNLSVPVSALVPAFELAAADPLKSILSDTLANVPMLVDLCCVKLSNKIEHLTEKDIPLSLIEKLETLQKCFCLNYIYRSSCLIGLSQVNSSRISRSLEVHLAGGGYSATLACRAVFCSRKCFQRFSQNHFAI